MLTGAIVGFGNVAQFGHWPAYIDNPLVRIAAIVDTSAERRAAATALDSSLRTFASLGELRSELPLDFVDICTPPGEHSGPILESVRYGFAVLCEKPLVTSMSSLKEISACAEAANVPVVPVHNWKYAPIIRRATDLLRDGAIGKLQQVQITTLRTRDAAAADSTRPGWRRDATAAGGGIVMDHGWHAAYLAINWFGETPGEVCADLRRPHESAVESEATVTITFPSGIATISLSWNANQRSNHVRLTGERGDIIIEDDLLIVDGNRMRFDQKLSAGSHHPEWFAAMLPDLLTALREPAVARPLFDEAVACLRVIERAYGRT
jgi:predicted dehydrogenase